MDETDILSALQNMSDEELKQLLQASNAPNRSAYVERELERARDFKPMGNYSTAGGAAMGGLASALREGASGYQQRELRGQHGQQMGLMENPQAARSIMGAVGMPGGAQAVPDPTLGAGGLVGGMGAGAAPRADPMQRQKMLIEMLRKSGGAGDLSMVPGMA